MTFMLRCCSCLLALTAPRFSPAGLAQSGTEHGEQSALFAWANRAAYVGITLADDMAAYAMPCIDPSKPLALPELLWLHAIPNGGERTRSSAGNMKAEGVKPGVADIFWPVPSSGKHGLYIEMKRRNGVPSDVNDKQRDFRSFVLTRGYAWCWAKGWLIARDRLISYACGQWSAELEEIK